MRRPWLRPTPNVFNAPLQTTQERLDKKILSVAITVSLWVVLFFIAFFIYQYIENHAINSESDDFIASQIYTRPNSTVTVFLDNCMQCKVRYKEAEFMLYVKKQEPYVSEADTQMFCHSKSGELVCFRYNATMRHFRISKKTQSRLIQVFDSVIISAKHGK
jgi:hypothetical protein